VLVQAFLNRLARILGYAGLMNWAGKQHPLETLAEWCAPAILAGAIGWCATRVGIALPVSAAVTGAAFAVGLIAVRSIGRAGNGPSFAFEPAPLGAEELDELLLDTPIEVVSSNELLLDDPLTDVAEDARVVRLFAKQEPTPGELVARIEDFLGEGARRPAPQPVAERKQQAIPDAGAALQAALANVRASLK
jgi:hypothetical protein